MNQVTFYLMRHPDHKNDVVDDEGKGQIRRATLKHLTSVGFDHAFCTEFQRSYTTAETVLDFLSQKHDPDFIQPDPDCGYQYAVDGVGLKCPFPSDIISERQRQGHFISVVDVCTHFWPPATSIRFVLQLWMKTKAQRFGAPSQRAGFAPGGKPSPRSVNVLVGNHASNVYAAPKPHEVNGYPPRCSIAVYRWVVDDLGETSLADFRLLLPD